MKHSNDVVAICLSVALGKNIDSQDISDPTQLALAYSELTLNQQKYDMGASEHFKVTSIIGFHYLYLTATTDLSGMKTYETIWSPSFDDFLDRSLLYFS